MEKLIKKEECILGKLNDKGNFLIKELMLFKTVSEYINQLLPKTTSFEISSYLVANTEYTEVLKNYFVTKFSPNTKNREEKLSEQSANLDNFQGEFSQIINAVFRNIVRTNYFLYRAPISIKVEVKNFKNLLEGLQPNFEMFVFHPEFMGTHLRMTKVSRGGLRWSERADFREEIKSLMITQDGKNSIIVPAGAKGGFLILTDEVSKEVFNRLYSTFINNLLDLVDNRENGQIVRYPNMVCYDSDDTYFVVAADKGTAQMSDVANDISISRHFWLGDAFASGGSHGYSHKDLGITAKGSFVSTERFFLEKGVNFYNESISVVGIGSMNGDVFGNGINLSSKFNLIGAISHSEIFIDPNSDSEIAFKERQRLFTSENGSWRNYNKELISKGGGVFKKSDSNIPVSAEMQSLFNISENEISGENLIKKMITAKVDLLFNGGVGTYVKSSKEDNSEVGDIGNIGVRVDAQDLQAFAVCEGGNLGFTQKARVEFAKKGGKINLDGIDNSAGVNISDHEVNIKILLSQIKLHSEERYEILEKSTDEVVDLVLASSYNQALGLSLDETRAKNGIEKFAQVVNVLENNLPEFQRESFAIPSENDFSLTRPNLSFLFSYSKIFLTKLLIQDDKIINSFSSSEFLFEYFPKSLHQFSTEILNHLLKKEIIATIIADQIINFQGVSFITEFAELGHERFMQVLARYIKIEKMVSFDEMRKEFGDSCNYEKLISVGDSLLKIEKEFRNL